MRRYLDTGYNKYDRGTLYFPYKNKINADEGRNNSSRGACGYFILRPQSCSTERKDLIKKSKQGGIARLKEEISCLGNGHDGGKVGADVDLDRVRGADSEVAPIDKAMDTVVVENNLCIPHELGRNVPMGVGKVNDLLEDRLAGDSTLVELHVERNSGGAVSVDVVGQGVKEIEQTQLVTVGAHAECLDKVVLVLWEGMDHLQGVAVVGRLEGGGGLEDVVGWGCGEEFEGPVLVRGLGHGRGTKVLRDGHLRLDSCKAGVEGDVGRSVGVSGQGQKCVSGAEVVQEVSDACDGGIKGSGGDEVVVSGDENHVLDGRGADVRAVVGGVEGDSSKFEGQIGRVLDVDDGGHEDGAKDSARVGVDQEDIVDSFQAVETLEGGGGLKANVGDGQVAKDAEVELGVDGALESDIVGGRGGEGADKF